VSTESISLQFILKRTNLSWGEAKWGLNAGFLSRASLIELAWANLKAGSENELELSLAGMKSDDAWETDETFTKLCASEPQVSDEAKKRKWLFLKLDWLFNNRSKAVVDDLKEIERLYDDFGFPEEIRAFVRFMPPEDGYNPLEHTQIENEARLIRLWQNYLSRAANEFSPLRASAP
jgi:hypothetical protein